VRRNIANNNGKVKENLAHVFKNYKPDGLPLKSNQAITSKNFTAI